MNDFVKIKIYGVTTDGVNILINQTDLTQNGVLEETKSGGWMGDLVTIFDGESCLQSSDLVERCVTFWGRSAPVVYKRLKNLDLIKTRDGNTMWYSLGEIVEEDDYVMSEERWSKKQLRELDAYNLTYEKNLTDEDEEGLRVLDGDWNQIKEIDMTEELLDFDSDDKAVQDAVDAFLGGEDNE